MPIVLEERWGQSLDEGTFVRQYLVRGATTVFDIRAEIEATLPFYVDNWKTRSEPQIDELQGGELFYVTIVWKNRQTAALALTEEEFWFDTGGGPQTQAYSLAPQVNYVKAATPAITAINYRGAIRMTDDGPQGVEVPRPNLTLGVTRIFDKADIDNAYMATLTSLTGGVNNAAFRGFSAGEMMLTNVNGRNRNVDEMAISMRFAARSNDLIDIGDITNIDVDGWDHVDVYYDKTVEDGFIIHIPRQAVVSKIARRRDFSLLGIGIT